MFPKQMRVCHMNHKQMEMCFIYVVKRYNNVINQMLKNDYLLSVRNVDVSDMPFRIKRNHERNFHHYYDIFVLLIITVSAVGSY